MKRELGSVVGVRVAADVSSAVLAMPVRSVNAAARVVRSVNAAARVVRSVNAAAQTALRLRLGRSDIVEHGPELVRKHAGGDLVAGDCCSANGTPGCDDPACCQAVCDYDAFCCTTEWNSYCADAAALLCGELCPGPSPWEPGTGDCCSAPGARVSNGRPPCRPGREQYMETVGRDPDRYTAVLGYWGPCQ